MKLPSPVSAVTSLSVAMRTISGIAIAGGVFGLGVMALIMLSSGGGEPAVLVALGMAIGFGMILAAMAGLLVVLVLLGLMFAGNRGLILWTPDRIRYFAIVAGGISGFACLAIPAGVQPEVMLWALVPGFIGAVGAGIMVNPLVKVAQRERNEAQAEDDSEAPLSFETPPI